MFIGHSLRFLQILQIFFIAMSKIVRTFVSEIKRTNFKNKWKL